MFLRIRAPHFGPGPRVGCHQRLAVRSEAQAVAGLAARQRQQLAAGGHAPQFHRVLRSVAGQCAVVGGHGQRLDRAAVAGERAEQPPVPCVPHADALVVVPGEDERAVARRRQAVGVHSFRRADDRKAPARGHVPHGRAGRLGEGDEALAGEDAPVELMPKQLVAKSHPLVVEARQFPAAGHVMHCGFGLVPHDDSVAARAGQPVAAECQVERAQQGTVRQPPQFQSPDWEIHVDSHKQGRFLRAKGQRRASPSVQNTRVRGVTVPQENFVILPIAGELAAVRRHHKVEKPLPDGIVARRLVEVPTANHPVLPGAEQLATRPPRHG